MPSRIATPCARLGCSAASYGRFCTRHTVEERRRQEARRPTAPQRGYGTEWRHLRYAVLLRAPICRICGVASSTDADHIIPRAQGGFDTMQNLQGACKPCHSRKTAGSDGGFGNARDRG